MDIHEYQAKELLSGFGVNVPRGGVAYSPEQAVYVATELVPEGGRRRVGLATAALDKPVGGDQV